MRKAIYCIWGILFFLLAGCCAPTAQVSPASGTESSFSVGQNVSQASSYSQSLAPSAPISEPLGIQATMRIQNQEYAPTDAEPFVQVQTPAWVWNHAIFTFSQPVKRIEVTFEEEQLGVYDSKPTPGADWNLQYSIEFPQRDGTYLVSVYTENESGDIYQSKFVLKVGTGQVQKSPLSLPVHTGHENRNDCQIVVTKQDSVPFVLTTKTLADFNLFDLIPLEQAHNPVPLEVPKPFEVTITCQGQSDTFSFSQQGVTYRGQIYYPADRTQMQRFLQLPWVQWDFVYLRDYFAMDVQDIASIAYTEINVMGETHMVYQTQEEIAQVFDELGLSEWVVHLYEKGQQRMPSEEFPAQRWVFTLQNGDVYVLRCDWLVYAVTFPDNSEFAFSKLVEFF